MACSLVEMFFKLLRSGQTDNPITCFACFHSPRCPWSLCPGPSPTAMTSKTERQRKAAWRKRSRSVTMTWMSRLSSITLSSPLPSGPTRASLSASPALVTRSNRWGAACGQLPLSANAHRVVVQVYIATITLNYIKCLLWSVVIIKEGA